MSWTNKAWAPIGVHKQHFRPVSTQIGSFQPQPVHRYPMFEKAKPVPSVRFLQAPFLMGEMSNGAGIDSRPASSVGTFAMVDKQRELLTTGDARLAERMHSVRGWTAARTTRTTISDVPDAYLTSTLASFQERPAADMQQHRLRGFTTSSFVGTTTADRLNSAATPCPTASLTGGSSLHSQRFLGLRDSDGTRRLLDTHVDGSPSELAPTETAPLPPPPPASSFVSSQPTTRNTDTVHAMVSGEIDPSRGVFNRVPWPEDAKINTFQHRRPGAMDVIDGQMRFQEHKIEKKKEAMRAARAATPR